MWLRQCSEQDEPEKVDESLVRDKLTGNYRLVALAMEVAKTTPNQFTLITGGGACRYGWFE